MSESANNAPLITADGFVRVRWDLVVAILTVVVSATIVYATLERRITALEIQSKIQADDVKEIKQDVKTLLRYTASYGNFFQSGPKVP